MQRSKDENGGHAEDYEDNLPGITEGESAGPKQEPAADETDEDAEEVGEAGAVQGVGRMWMRKTPARKQER